MSDVAWRVSIVSMGYSDSWNAAAAVSQADGYKMTPNASSIAPTNTWNGDWQLFSYDHGGFLLHVPSSHILSIDDETLARLQSLPAGSMPDDVRTALEHLAAQLPDPVERVRERVDIRAIALNVIQSCNLRCTYCYAGDGDYGVDSRMSLDLAKSILDQFATGKESFSIAFFGGEPLLSFALIQDIVAYCQTKSETKFHYSMTTNGTVLNERILQFLKEHDFRITVSYDGKGIQAKQRLMPDKKNNAEALVERKLAAFSEQLQALRGFTLRGTIRREALPQLEPALFDIINSKTFKFSFNRHAAPHGTGHFTMDDVKSIDAALSHVSEALVAEQRYADVLRLGNLRQHMAAFHHGEVNQNFCGAGIHYLSVSTRGRYYLCHRFTEDESAVVGDAEHGLDFEKLARYGQHRMIDHDPCRSCWMRQWCAGGCFHENKLANKTEFQADPIFCALQDVEMRHAMRLYTLLRERAPELLETL